MNTRRDAEDVVWRALSHATRREILDVLVESPSTTGELVTRLAMDRHLVMAHLSVLRDANLVLTEKRGRQRVNFLNAVPIQEIHHRWVAPVDAPWAAALVAVRDAAEAVTLPERTIEERKKSG